MKSNYWQSVANRRVSRRSAVLTVGAAGFGATLLAACGGGSSTKEKTASLVASPIDSTKSAVRGGIYKASLAADLQTFDPMFTSTPSGTPTNLAYSRLFMVKPGILEPTNGDIIGDFVQSWEFSGDKLTLTTKLRPDSKAGPTAPVNGRLLDSADVLFSWNRYAATATSRATLSNAASPAAPIVSVSAPDPQTVVWKLSQPLAATLALMGTSNTGNLFIVPKEAESAIDLRREQIGSGPWYLSEYSPSTRLVYKRNPGYYDKDHPYADALELPIISEYATGLAQLKAGALYTYGVHGEDIISVKNETPDLVIHLTDVTVDGVKAFYGAKPSPAEKTPFRDERVRQAFSMSWDRDLWIDTFYNVSQFQASGVPIETRWSSALRASDYQGWWIDPRSKDFGENSKYYKRDLTAAKALLSAAGFTNGLDVDAHYVTTGEYGVDFNKHIEVLLGFANEVGIRAKTVPVNFNTEWRPQYADAQGNFEGMSFRVSAVGGNPDEGEKLYAEYNSKAGIQFTGFDPSGKGTFAGDPKMDDLTNQLRVEFDPQKRMALAQEVQRYNGQKQYNTLTPGGATGLGVSWPAVQNRDVYRNDARLYIYEWLDQKKPPFKV